jgi:hypothetical protein
MASSLSRGSMGLPPTVAPVTQRQTDLCQLLAASNCLASTSKLPAPW